MKQAFVVNWIISQLIFVAFFLQETLVHNLQVSVAKYVELYCTENGEECLSASLIEQTVESIAYGPAANDEMFLSVENRLFDKKNTQGLVETHHYRVMQGNVTVE